MPTPSLDAVVQVLALLDSPAAVVDGSGVLLAANAAFETVVLGDSANRSRIKLFDGKQPDTDAARTMLSIDGREVECRLSRFMVGAAPAYIVHAVGEGFSGRRLRRLMDRLELGFWEYDVATGTFLANDAWRRLRGLDPSAPINLRNGRWARAIHPDDRDRLVGLYEAQRIGDVTHANIQYRHWHSANRWVWILCRAHAVGCDAEGRPTRVVGVDTEITDLKEMEAASAYFAEKLRLAVEVAGLGIFEFDRETATVHWDDRMLDIYGVDDGRNHRSGDFWESHLHPEDRAELVAYAEACQAAEQDFARDYRIVRPDGEVRHVRSLARQVRSPTLGSKLVGVNIDITEDTRRSEELEAARRRFEHASTHDALTGLGNRRHLDEHRDALFARLSPDDSYAVVLIDLDHFKALNDACGHAAGDVALTTVAGRIARIVATHGKAFRVGGDEFAVILDPAPTAARIALLCEDLIAALTEPFEYNGRSCRVGASIGHATGHGPPTPTTDMFLEADRALYAAKSAGRSCYRAAEDLPETPDVVPACIDRDLAKAIDQGEITCVYQPQYGTRRGGLVGAEALARWISPMRGMVSPAQFLGRAKEAGYISAVDRAVFAAVLRQQTEWHAAGLSVPAVSVNVSKNRLRDTHLSVQLGQLEAHHRLAFELTETSMFDDLDDPVRSALEAIREAGIGIDLDDFGSGHASVLALQRIEPDRIKISRKLVASVVDVPHRVRVVQALATIARAEGCGVVLEGVETERHVTALEAVDCDALQGFALGEPMRRDVFTTLLQGLQRRTAAG
ncbi:MAG: EAL domain-containing protein [Pseudomonadota bacterium]